MNGTWWIWFDAGGLGVVDEGVESPLTPNRPEQAEHCLIPIVHPLRRGRARRD